MTSRAQLCTMSLRLAGVFSATSQGGTPTSFRHGNQRSTAAGWGGGSLGPQRGGCKEKRAPLHVGAGHRWPDGLCPVGASFSPHSCFLSGLHLAHVPDRDYSKRMPTARLPCPSSVMELHAFSANLLTPESQALCQSAVNPAGAQHFEGGAAGKKETGISGDATHCKGNGHSGR